MFKKLVFPIMFILSIVWLFLSWRLSAALVLIIVIFLYVTLHWHKNFKYLLVFWYVFVLLTIVPVDITMINYKGAPKFVPYSPGLPTTRAKLLVKEEKIVIGSDVVTGFEPKWVLVW